MLSDEITYCFQGYEWGRLLPFYNPAVRKGVRRQPQNKKGCSIGGECFVLQAGQNKRVGNDVVGRGKARQMSRKAAATWRTMRAEI